MKNSILILLCLLTVFIGFIFLLVFVLNQQQGQSSSTSEPKRIEYRHHNNEELETILNDFALEYPHLTRLYTIGRSVKNTNVYALEISDNPGIHEPGEAEIKLIGNIHGNEVVGRELLLHLIEHLLSTYENDVLTNKLVNNLRIHIVPSMNPDGYERAIPGDCSGVLGRRNEHNIDLNRNFPDHFHKKEREGTSNEEYNGNVIQIETKNIMLWSKQYPFVLSASLHGGALVANYPYDNNEHNEQRYTKSPDDDTFRHLALVYSMNHPYMHLGYCNDTCDIDSNSYFKDGITNGAAWYPVSGGMQDWNYHHTNCFELTIEVGCKKYPLAEELEKYWLEHKNSLVMLMNCTYDGIHGFVIDGEDGGAIQEATISIAGINKNVTTYKHGDYWRLLKPKQSYTITASKEGYSSQTITIDHLNVSYQLNFTLTKNKNL